MCILVGTAVFVSVFLYRYSWKKDNQYLRGNGSRTLEFKLVTDRDEGYYQCCASNEHGTAVSDFKYLPKEATDSTQEPARGAKDDISSIH